MNVNMDGSFAIASKYFDNTHETELEMFVNGENILSFRRNETIMSTRWNLDELAIWMRHFVDNMEEDPYPVDVMGEYAAEKDVYAREYDSDDEEEFDTYYDKLDEWNTRHRWHTASGGAILADLYFQLVGDYVEISWNNEDLEDGVVFQTLLGGTRVRRLDFEREVNLFLKDYAEHWF